MMLIFFWLCLIGVFRAPYVATYDIWHITINPLLKSHSLRSAQILLNTTNDVIRDSEERIHSLYQIKQDHVRTAPYEVGYLVFTVTEQYRKMVDKFNTSHFMNTRLYIMELVLYLEEIERHFWEIKHFVNMAHEIERKYKIQGGVEDDYRMENIDINQIRTTPAIGGIATRATKKKKLKWSRYLLEQQWGTTKKRSKGQFPIDYGWEVDGSATSLEFEELLKELSWALKVKILKDMPGVSTQRTQATVSSTPLATPEDNEAQRRFENNPARRVRMEALLIPKRRQIDEPSTAAPEAPVEKPDAVAAPLLEVTNDENNMRLKLFRLMYETVRDSDLKVKRAELIQDRYTNLTSFQIGYLMGDVTDKFSIMSDIASTLKRFYGAWKPIEHINAYEQIANQAIELSHLIQLIQTAGKNASPPPGKKSLK